MGDLHLLFWLSLLPFVTGWLGENHLTASTVALYGGVLMMAAIAYYILVRVLLRGHGSDTALAKAIGKDSKGKLSIALYLGGIALAGWLPWLAIALYCIVAIIWLVPDRRIERHLEP